MRDFQFHSILRKGFVRAPDSTSKYESGSVILNVVIGISIISVLSLAYADIYQSVRKAQAKVDF